MAEVRKRGDEFWGEFEFYLSDLCVGLVLDVVLVTLIAPVALAGRAPKSGAAAASGGGGGVEEWGDGGVFYLVGEGRGGVPRCIPSSMLWASASSRRRRHPAAAGAGGLRKLLGRLPSAVFERGTAARPFTPLDRAATYVKLGLEYSLGQSVCALGLFRLSAPAGRAASLIARNVLSSVTSLISVAAPLLPSSAPCRSRHHLRLHRPGRGQLPHGAAAALRGRRR